MEVSYPDLAPYVLHARQVAALRREQTGDRFEWAWDGAREIAAFLHARYQPVRAVVFGSLLHRESFGPESDIDMAVEGIDWPAYLHAWNEVESMVPGFTVDLIDLAVVSDRLRRRIEEEGQAL